VAAELVIPNLPTDELVAVEWFATIPGLSRHMVATQLPPDVRKNGDAADWVTAGLGFLTIAVVGGGADPMLPVKKPVVQADAWATVLGSNKPPWNVANRIMEAIRYATWDRLGIARPLTIVSKGLAYPSAVVTSAYVATAPRRILDDAGDYARFSMDVALTWVTVNDQLA
jgi:hypothetical protein